MTQPLTLGVLLGAFGLISVAALLVAAIAGWRLALRRLEQRVPRELAARRAAMTELSTALARDGVDAAQAARLRLSYRTHRAAILALDPRSDVANAPEPTIASDDLRAAA